MTTIPKNDPNYINVVSFEHYKNAILSLDVDTKYKIFNMFFNDDSLRHRHINYVLSEAIRMAKENSISLYKQNISFDDYYMFVHNFSTITLRVLTVDELLTCSVDGDFIRRYMEY